MDIVELKQKNKKELEKMAEDSRQKLEQLGFDLKAGRLKNVRELRSARKDIARILTILKLK